MITSFKQPGCEFLSNFHPSPIPNRNWGVSAPTVEHAYQACKASKLADQQRIVACATPGQAKRLGSKIQMRQNWDSQKLDIMTRLVTMKFTLHRHLAMKLIDTGDEQLIEGNRWHDLYWGKCYCDRHQGEGENHLGLILMMTRAQLVSDYVIRDAHAREKVNHG